MISDQNFKQPGVSLPPLTHQRIGELKQTPQGQRIMQEQFTAFPGLIKSLTHALQEKLTAFEKARTTAAALPKELTTDALIADYQFLEFVQHIMFLKWREEKNNQAGRHFPGNLQAN
ncbi:hypothetical protein ECE50_004275 [Chitinophaga sp. Mgbs1]|uniref:Uncharacterized protein n=1 Tax=Chitinophaga solisilvae TaxID=1233460 RepID=A0A3S1D5R8_9BACT|nr:hypothetical protein [Chitinophaga solisilvae]